MMRVRRMGPSMFICYCSAQNLPSLIGQKFNRIDSNYHRNQFMKKGGMMTVKIMPNFPQILSWLTETWSTLPAKTNNKVIVVKVKEMSMIGRSFRV